MILVDWMLDLSEHFRLSDSTIQLAVAYLDLYLSKNQNIPRKNLQLAGVTCLKIAHCYKEQSREYYRMVIAQEYASMTENQYTAE